MSTTTATIESAILGRVIEPDQIGLPAEAARALLTLRFKDRDLGRMRELAEKARQGTLTSDEQQEIESYERIGSLLGLLQSKARLSLVKHG